jgi:hypothetical protein
MGNPGPMNRYCIFHNKTQNDDTKKFYTDLFKKSIPQNMG